MCYCLLTESPFDPRSFSIFNVTSTSVVLSWLPPEDGGVFYTITAAGNNLINMHIDVMIHETN